MESFLGVPDITPWSFSGLALASFMTAIVGVVLGAAGGLMLLAIMAVVFPPAVLIPVHTLVQLGTSSSRALILWRWVLRDTMAPFLLGAVIGAATGAQIFLALPTVILQGILGAFVLVIAWLPTVGRVGGTHRRFAALGFVTTFLGMFVSATGTLLAPFVSAASPDRRNHAATLGALMFLVHITKLVAFGVLGVAIGAYLPLVAAMVTTAVLGNWTGRLLLDRMPERLFRLGFKLLMTVLALRLLWVAGRDGGWF